MNEPKLSRELLEAVLDPNKEKSDTVDRLLTIRGKMAEEDPTLQRTDEEVLEVVSRSYKAGEWMNFGQLIEESTVIQGVINETCDSLRPSPETCKREDLPRLKEMMARINEDYANVADAQPAEFFFRNRVRTQMEKFFRAGWEARGMAESAEQLKQMTGD
jgi:hypothetical protein